MKNICVCLSWGVNGWILDGWREAQGKWRERKAYFHNFHRQVDSLLAKKGRSHPNYIHGRADGGGEKWKKRILNRKHSASKNEKRTTTNGKRNKLAKTLYVHVVVLWLFKYITRRENFVAMKWGGMERERGGMRGASRRHTQPKRIKTKLTVLSKPKLVGSLASSRENQSREKNYVFFISHTHGALMWVFLKADDEWSRTAFLWYFFFFFLRPLYMFSCSAARHHRRCHERRGAKDSSASLSAK